MSQVVPDQQKSLMEFPCSKNPSLFNIKEGPLPPSIQLFLTDLGESVLIYQLVALVVCYLVVVVVFVSVIVISLSRVLVSSSSVRVNIITNHHQH